MSIKSDIKKAQIKRKLQDAINTLPDFRQRKNDISTLEYCCKIIENNVCKNSHIDKLELLFEVMEICFDKLTDLEKVNIKKNVSYLLASGAIKKYNLKTKIWKAFKHFFLEK